MINVQEVFRSNDFSSFEEIDPYNSNNTVAGFISRANTELYGALLITHVNGKEVYPQLIYCTPKMHYPFDSKDDGSRQYKFPIAKNIEVYTKLDGTNVFAYSYRDADNNIFVSYKTRLRPFLGSGNFGDFYGLWNEITKAFLSDPLKNIQIQISKFIKESNINLSFELWGARNPHLIMYKESLCFSLLFGVTNAGNIVPPTKLNVDKRLNSLSPLMTIDKNYVELYELTQRQLDLQLTKTDDEYYQGDEGTVWYLNLLDGRCQQIKCKPSTIEAIHFSAGLKNINKQVILATCWNGFENTDNITVEFIKTLLLEEFRPELVEASTNQIIKCIAFVIEELNFRKEVINEYQKTNKNIATEKREVMRELSTKFPKSKMEKVFSIIASYK